MLHVDAARGLPPGERVLLLVRPETVAIEAVGDEPEPEGALIGEVISHIFLGSVTRVRVVDATGEEGITGDVPPSHAAALPIGTRVVARFPRESPRLLSLAEQPEPVAADPDGR